MSFSESPNEKSDVFNVTLQRFLIPLMTVTGTYHFFSLFFGRLTPPVSVLKIPWNGPQP